MSTRGLKVSGLSRTKPVALATSRSSLVCAASRGARRTCKTTKAAAASGSESAPSVSVFFSEEDLKGDVLPFRLRSKEELISNERASLKRISELEKRALELQCSASAEESKRKLLQDITELERRALELQCFASAEESEKKILQKSILQQRKLLQDISEVERKVLERQYTASAEESKRKLLQNISDLEKKALELQCSASAEEAKRKFLQDITELERKALELQCSASAEESQKKILRESILQQRKLLQDITELERKALELQCSASAEEFQKKILRESILQQRKLLQDITELERKALELQFSDTAEEEGVLKEKRFSSSWDAPSNKTGKYAKEGADYLYELGASDDINLSIDVGQTSQYIDKKFALDITADIADGTLRKFEFRKFNNIKGDYWIPPRFQEKVVFHITKNNLEDLTDYFPQVPLVLGIFGGKGEGKSFLTELVLKRLGAEAIVMSAGELEDEIAGRPAKLIRERYRKAADMSKVRGKLTALVINDIDAGVGTHADTQNTVNTQMVVGTLMNLCDNPKRVSVGQDWQGKDIIRRVPIIVTANDLNTIYAPLLRDGRMEKFYWKPDEEDMFNMIYTMFKDDNVTPEEVVQVRSEFPNQGLDFFGALRARCADTDVRKRMEEYECENGGLSGPPGYLRALMRDIRNQVNTEGDKVNVEVSLERLLEEGRSLAQEQQYVNDVRLAGEYLKNMDE